MRLRQVHLDVERGLGEARCKDLSRRRRQEERVLHRVRPGFRLGRFDGGRDVGQAADVSEPLTKSARRAGGDRKLSVLRALRPKGLETARPSRAVLATAGRSPEDDPGSGLRVLGGSNAGQRQGALLLAQQLACGGIHAPARPIVQQRGPVQPTELGLDDGVAGPAGRDAVIDRGVA